MTEATKDQIMSRNADETARAAARPSRAEAKAGRRLVLIEATITAIARHGLTGTTLARVAEIAGTSAGLANFHFASKERLFEAVLDHLAEEQRAIWQARQGDVALSTADRLMAIVDSRFHSHVCDRRKLAIWFAFYGDAGARALYRRAVGDLDDALLDATVAILTEMIDEAGYVGIDPMETALAFEAMYDGLWLNMLLYPDDFRRQDCKARAVAFISAMLPRHFAAAQGGGRPGGPGREP